MAYSRNRVLTAPTFSDYPSTLGVASGEPRPDRVVLWTRLAPVPLNGGGMPPNDVDVRWEMATDENFTNVVRSGTEVAAAYQAHSVHVADQGLEPSTYYWCRFKAGDEISPVGRTKTTPPYGAPLSSPKFAFASCADYQEGYFPAYRAIAEEEDLDIVFHLGDYIYEYAPDPSSTRVAKTPAPDDIFTYRDTYAEYKLDPGLQAAHAMHPWMVILAEAPAPGPACHVEVAEARRREAVGPGAGAGHGIGGELGAPVEVGRTGRSIFRDGHLDRFPVDGAAVEEKTSRGTPASRIASRRLSVPRTLVR